MKRILIGLTCMIVFIMSIVSVSAISLGNDNTEASNINEDINTFLSATVSNANITATTVCTTTNINAKYVDSETANVANNINVTYEVSAGSVKVTGRIPENLDSVDVNNLPNQADDSTSFQVATVSCQDNSTVVFTEALFMQRENAFELSKIFMTYGDFEETFSEDGDDVDGLDPGLLLEFEVEGENKFSDDDDVDLENMDVTIVCPDDIGEDDDDEMDINADEKESVFLEIELDEDDVEDKTYTCTVTVFGEDEYGATHGEEWDIELEVEKEKYEVDIQSVTINPSQISCDARGVDISVELKNIGRNDDDDIRLVAEAASLGINQELVDIDLDETDETRKRFSFTIDEEADAKTHPFTIKVYSRKLLLTDTETVDLVVPNCGQEEEEPVAQPQPVTPPVVQQPTTPVVQQPAQPTQPTAPVVVEDTNDVEENEEEATDAEVGNTLYVVLLVVLIVVLLGGVIGLLIYLLKPSN